VEVDRNARALAAGMTKAFKVSTRIALAGMALISAAGAWARFPIPRLPSSETLTTRQPAPGTTPVSGDQPPPVDRQQSTAPCPAPQKHKKREHQHKNSADKRIGQDEPGLTPLHCAGASGSNNSFDPDRIVGVGSDMIKIRPGSIEDVNAVGDRDIGGRGLGNWYSVEDEIKMGKQYADQVDKSSHFITDPVIDEYINRIGQNIVKNSDCKVPFIIKVIDTDEVNAFALPGGFFYVNSGLILDADSEAELAGVMAHETAHVCAHHAAREMTRMNYAQLGMIPLIMMTGYSWAGYGIYEASQFAVPVAFLEFSREFEAQADYLGVQYMYRAGYDPQAYIRFFENIQALEKRKPGLIAKAFDTHPQTPDRIEHTQEEIAEILPARDEYLDNTSEFIAIKARLARIENRRRLARPNRQAPSLRRANNPGNGDDGGYQPTLHRRDDQDQD
jgi:beta-barrel assembly-enhancing protease